MKEKQIKVKIKNWLNKQTKSFFFKIHGSIFGLKGLPDLIGVYHGQFTAIEVKLPTRTDKDKDGTANQKWFIKKINDCGGFAFVAKSLDDVKKNMERGSAALSARKDK